MMPATRVPWPTVSVVPDAFPRSIFSPLEFLAGRLFSPLDASTALLSWGFLTSTPVSITATWTPLPVDRSHNWSRFTRCSAQGRPSYFFEGKVHWPVVESATAAGAAAGSSTVVAARTAVVVAASAARRANVPRRVASVTYGIGVDIINSPGRCTYFTHDPCGWRAADSDSRGPVGRKVDQAVGIGAASVSA